MKIIKKFTAIQLDTQTVDRNINIMLSFGRIAGPYYDEIRPTEEFDTEDEAIEYAYNFNKYGRWLILPVVRFE